jgi:hypothetical protein
MLRFFTICCFVALSFFASGQPTGLMSYKRHFDSSLKSWTITLKQFNLARFKVTDTLPFDNNNEQSFEEYPAFLKLHKPLLSFSPGQKQFIDIYSYQLNLEKKDGRYYASPDADQTIFLCNPQAKYWNRIFFGSPSMWIDEVVWVNEKEFLLAGVSKNEADEKAPFILLGNTGTQQLRRFTCTNKACVQTRAHYQSAKLKKLNIKGL